jgi:hypothetical protein
MVYRISIVFLSAVDYYHVVKSIRLPGIVQFRLYDLLLASKPGHKVVHVVNKALREKVFPPERRRSVEMAGRPGFFDSIRIKAIPPCPVELTEPEVELLVKVLQDAEPALSAEDCDWAYPLLEELAGARPD